MRRVILLVAAVGLWLANPGGLLAGDTPAPTGIRVVSVGDGTVTVAWEGVPEATLYRVYYRPGAVEPGSEPEDDWWWGSPQFDSDSREGTVPNLTNGVWYELRVAAGEFWSEESVLARPGTDSDNARLPGVPADLRVVEELEGSVTVAWDPPEGGAAGYEVWHKPEGFYGQDTPSWVMSGSVDGDVGSYTISGLVDFRRYQVIVAAINDTGRGLFTPPVWPTAGGALAGEMSAPTGVRLVAVGEGTVTVAWEGVPEATPYKVVYRPVAVVPGSEPAGDGWWGSPLFDSESREGTVPNLTNGVWYELRVAAGEFWSEESVLARPGPDSDSARIPGVPADLRVVGELIGQVTVAWDPPEGGAAGYEVWYRPVGVSGEDPPSWVMSGSVDGDVGSYTISGLVDFQRYQVIVAAVNDTSRGPFTQPVWPAANGADLDPLGLIANYRHATAYTTGSDLWEVWACDVPDGHEHIDIDGISARLNRALPPYFRWLSGGLYQPDFIAGGTVRVNQRGTGKTGEYGCADAVAELTGGDAHGALIILDKSGGVAFGGTGGFGYVYPDDGTVRYEQSKFPANDRTVHAPAPYVRSSVGFEAIAHEVGHALGWPHSYGGNRQLPAWVQDLELDSDEYDNPMDLMSQVPGVEYSGPDGISAGTIAINRYAAGWLPLETVKVHSGQPTSYLLSPPGVTGTQMVVLPSGQPGRFVTLGARLREGYDRGLPVEGVEVYRVDQRAIACDAEREGLSCTTTERRTSQIPPPSSDDGRSVRQWTDHVYGPGDTLTVDGYRVDVVERVGDRFQLWVGPPHRGQFADDDGNVHEPNIDRLADLSVAVPCDSDLRHYCPDRPITRGEMAMFLVRAVDGGDPPPSRRSRFSDVPANVGLSAYVERLAELGITAGYPDGTFRPDSPVNRGQMAVFLTRAFPGLASIDTPSGVFIDVPVDDPYAVAVETIRAAQITAGCAAGPDRFCPERPVRRDQMATFLAKALGQS